MSRRLDSRITARKEGGQRFEQNETSGRPTEIQIADRVPPYRCFLSACYGMPSCAKGKSRFTHDFHFGSGGSGSTGSQGRADALSYFCLKAIQ